jgi:hypothetical protein
MRIPLRIATACALFALAAAPALAQAQAEAQTTRSGAPASSQDRFFLSFAEDPALAQRQWWEIRGEFINGGKDNPVDTILARFNFAIQPIRGLELGGNVGFGSTDAPGGLEDGTGATDFDVHGKWNFGTRGGTSFAAGVVATIPTGDDSVGLGYDAFGVKAFGSVRHDFGGLILVADAGIRFNDNGRVGGARLKGKTSASVAGGVLFPVSPDFSFLAEGLFETARFDETDTDARILGGINWRPARNGVIRGAIGFGLTDFAPDFQVIAGYAFTF